MKKVMFALAMAAMFSFAACNSNKTEAPVEEEAVVEAIEEVVEDSAVGSVAEEVVEESEVVANN